MERRDDSVMHVELIHHIGIELIRLQIFILLFHSEIVPYDIFRLIYILIFQIFRFE